MRFFHSAYCGTPLTYLTCRCEDAEDLATTTDPLGHTTTRTYDEFSRLATQTDPLGRQFPEISISAAKRAWARLIKQVYEVDPLLCPLLDHPRRHHLVLGEQLNIKLPLPDRVWVAPRSSG